MEVSSSIHTVYLAGNPNCGKTSLFNLLAGLNQKVSNIPGTTVEKVEGKIRLSDGSVKTLIDLPGAYTLYPGSEDELVAGRNLLQAKNAVIVFVADATRLQSNLFYFTQIADLGLPMVLVLNMTDVAKSKGIVVDTALLSQLLGVRVVETSARKSQGIQQLKQVLPSVYEAYQRSFVDPDSHANSNVFSAYKLAIQQQFDASESGTLSDELALVRKNDATYRQIEIQHIANQVIDVSPQRVSFLEKLDSKLIHPVWGLGFLFLLLFLVFQAVFSLAELPMQGIEWLFFEAGSLVRTYLPPGFFNDLLVEGVISGLAGIVVFLPQILILFFFIGILEETGYITRVSFLTDRFMQRFGLNGKSVIPMAGGLACAIPSVMAARSIENKAEKLATILITPLMTCSARLPVYTLLISLMVPEEQQVGIFNVRGLVLMGMYLLGFVSALLFALLFKLFIRAKIKDYFVLEMPELRPPRWKALFINLYRKGMTFLTGAGKVILVVSLLLFVLKKYGPPTQMNAVHERYQALAFVNELSEDQVMQMEAELLKTSYAGQLGQLIEPVIEPLGYDWKIGIALITSFAAREVFVGTMSAIYGVADDEEGLGLRAKLQSELNPDTGKPVYSFPVLLSLLIFYAFALQCMSTIAVVYRETNSIKWPVLQLVMMTGVAYLFSMLAFNLASI